MTNAKAFYETYVRRLGAVTVVEIGSQDVNGSIREHFVPPITYIGVDFAAAKGVDVILDDPYKLPFEDASTDVVVTSSCFEHSEFFWLVFTELARITKPGGLIYLNAPSNGSVHRWPVDCWRFYPDAGRALAKWATREGYPVKQLESCITAQNGGSFNDFVAVFVRDGSYSGQHPNRMQKTLGDFENGYIDNETERRNAVSTPEDQRIVMRVKGLVGSRLEKI